MLKKSSKISIISLSINFEPLKSISRDVASCNLSNSFNIDALLKKVTSSANVIIVLFFSSVEIECEFWKLLINIITIPKINPKPIPIKRSVKNDPNNSYQKWE